MSLIWCRDPGKSPQAWRRYTRLPPPAAISDHPHYPFISAFSRPGVSCTYVSFLVVADGALVFSRYVAFGEPPASLTCLSPATSHILRCVREGQVGPDALQVTSLLLSTQAEEAGGGYVLLSRSRLTVCLTSMWIASFLFAPDRSVRLSKSCCTTQLCSPPAVSGGPSWGSKCRFRLSISSIGFTSSCRIRIPFIGGMFCTPVRHSFIYPLDPGSIEEARSCLQCNPSNSNQRRRHRSGGVRFVGFVALLCRCTQWLPREICTGARQRLWGIRGSRSIESTAWPRHPSPGAEDFRPPNGWVR